MDINVKPSIKHPTAGVILAAGSSSRFGKQKLLADFRGKPVLGWVVDACLRSRLNHIVLVLGYDHQEIIETLSSKMNSPLVETVINDNYVQGQSSSLQKGLSRIRVDFPAAMFLLGDQPMLDSVTINHLLDCFYRSEMNICVPYYDNRRRNPTIFSSRYYDRIMRITGDIGARNIIENNADDVLKVEFLDPALFHDIDTLEDLQKYNPFAEVMRKQFNVAVERINRAIKK